MTQILEPGNVFHAESSGLKLRVFKLLGAGGQGEVYQASLNKQPVALKWYYVPSATPRQRKALEILVSKGPPDPSFLWPLDLTTDQTVPGFGYIMPLRDPRFKGIADLMKGRIDPSFKALATAGMNLAGSFLQLHAKGMCYRDISFGNVFFDPETGEVLICDNDNVAVDRGEKGGVIGTPRFMAPEVVRGEAWPSTETDLFSLSVLLFYIFLIHHPLEGKRELAIKCLDVVAMTDLYGKNPLFIFDPEDSSNAPDEEWQPNPIAFWSMYPDFLKRQFVKAFTDGLHDPSARIRESEWRNTLIRLRDSIIFCGDCGAENFYDQAQLKADGGTPRPCWSCAVTLRLPPRIKIDKAVVMLNHDTRIFPHHINPQRLFDFSSPIAQVTRHPTQSDVWGLTNLSEEKWVVTSSSETGRDVLPGKSLPLISGTKIHFGNKEGTIRL